MADARSQIVAAAVRLLVSPAPTTVELIAAARVLDAAPTDAVLERLRKAAGKSVEVRRATCGSIFDAVAVTPHVPRVRRARRARRGFVARLFAAVTRSAS